MIKKGDKVQLLLDNPYTTETRIIGIVVDVFDALTNTGEPGINLEIDIRYGTLNLKWFRYKPMIDGGTITVLNTGENNG